MAQTDGTSGAPNKNKNIENGKNMTKRTGNSFRAAFGFLALGLLALLLSESAHAVSIFAPTEGDKSVQWFFNRIFAGLLPSGTAGSTAGADPLLEMIKVFNGVALLVAGVIAAYILLIGTMKTAHEGEMMGRQWSGIWVPLRTALGTAMILPIKGGYCMAQMLVVWLAIQGVGVADKLWGTFVDSTLAKGDLMTIPTSPKIDQLTSATLESLVCIEMVNRQINTNPDTVLMANGQNVGITRDRVYDSTWLGLKESARPSEMVYYFGGDGKTNELARDLCGKASLPYATAETSAIASGATGLAIGAGLGVVPVIGLPLGAGVGAVVGGISGTFGDRIPEPTEVALAHVGAYHMLIHTLHPLAKELTEAVNGSGITPQLSTKVAALIAQSKADYVKTVVAKAGPYAENQGQAFQKMQAAMKEDGWMVAGAWYLRIVQIINKLNVATTEIVPVATVPSEIGAGYSKAFKQAKTAIAAATANDKLGLSEYVKDEKGDVAAGGTGFISKWIVKAFTGLNVHTLAEDARNPLILAQEIGNHLLTWSTAGVLASILLFTPIISPGAAAIAGPLVLSLAMVGMISGVTLSLYTPMIPLIFWMGAFIGWALLVVEAVVAAPLWALMKLTPQGDDIMGGSANAYKMLLSMTLRPGLMVIGLVASMLLLDAFGRIFNAVIISAVFNQDPYSLGTIVMAIGGAAAYVGMVIFLLHKLFGLIHAVPDNLLKWMGVSDTTQLGSTAGDAHKEGHTIVAAIGSNTQKSGDASVRGAQAYRGLKATEENNRLQGDSNRQNLAGSVGNLSNNMNSTMGAIDQATNSLSSTDDPAADATSTQKSACKDLASLGRSIASMGKQADGLRGQGAPGAGDLPNGEVCDELNKACVEADFTAKNGGTQAQMAGHAIKIQKAVEKVGESMGSESRSGVKNQYKDIGGG